MNDDARRWLAQTMEDRRTIDVLLDGGRYYMVCFLSQQTAEKALKAYLYARGEDPVFGHSVSKLCERCAGYDEAFGALKRRVKNLDQFYIEARYPNGLPNLVPAEFYDAADARAAVEMVDGVLETVRGRLEPEKRGRLDEKGT